VAGSSRMWGCVRIRPLYCAPPVPKMKEIRALARRSWPLRAISRRISFVLCGADARNGGADARGPADARSGADARRRCGAHPPLGENRGMVKEFARKQSIAILGGGPGGYEAALAGAQLGAEVTLVERVGVGGSAVLTDVVPSKTLIATAEAANAIGDASELRVPL